MNNNALKIQLLSQRENYLWGEDQQLEILQAITYGRTLGDNAGIYKSIVQRHLDSNPDNKINANEFFNMGDKPGLEEPGLEEPEEATELESQLIDLENQQFATPESTLVKQPPPPDTTSVKPQDMPNRRESIKEVQKLKREYSGKNVTGTVDGKETTLVVARVFLDPKDNQIKFFARKQDPKAPPYLLKDFTLNVGQKSNHEMVKEFQKLKRDKKIKPGVTFNDWMKSGKNQSGNNLDSLFQQIGI